MNAIPKITARPLVRPAFLYREERADFIAVNRVALTDWYEATNGRECGVRVDFDEFCAIQHEVEEEIFLAAGGASSELGFEFETYLPRYEALVMSREAAEVDEAVANSGRLM